MCAFGNPLQDGHHLVFNCPTPVSTGDGFYRTAVNSNRVEYQVLRKTTGSYHGGSHKKLLHIAGIEPLAAKLEHIMGSSSTPDPLPGPSDYILPRPHTSPRRPIARLSPHAQLDARETVSYRQQHSA